METFEWPACRSKSGRRDDKIVSGVWGDVTVAFTSIHRFLPSAFCCTVHSCFEALMFQSFTLRDNVIRMYQYALTRKHPLVLVPLKNVPRVLVLLPRKNVLRGVA